MFATAVHCSVGYRSIRTALASGKLMQRTWSAMVANGCQPVTQLLSGLLAHFNRKKMKGYRPTSLQQQPIAMEIIFIIVFFFTKTETCEGIYTILRHFFEASEQFGKCVELEIWQQDCCICHFIIRM